MNNIPPSLPVNTPAQRCGLALTSLVLGILGIVLCVAGPLFGIPAVICGHMAMSRINKSAGALSGHGMAMAGLITGYISIAMIVVIGMLAAIAVPNFTKARLSAQRHACYFNLQAIQGCKNQWALEQKKEDSAIPRDQDLFGEDKYMAKKPECPGGGIYNLNPVNENPTCSIPGHKMPLSE